MSVFNLNTGRAAGEEGSSTYEGRHLTFYESELTHPYHADGFVDKGDPVLVGNNIVGVALSSAAASTDLIAIDTEGIWYLTVLGCVSDASSDGIALTLAAGDPIFFQRTPPTVAPLTVLSGQSDPYHFVPFGRVLGAVTGSTTSGTIVAVKVHGESLPDMGRINLGSGYGATGNFLLEGSGTLRRANWVKGNFAPESILLSGEQIQGIQIRMTDNLASTGGEICAAEFKAMKEDSTNVSVSNLTGVKIGIANTDGGSAPEVKALVISMGGVPGAAAAMQTAIQVMGDGTMGTLQSWFQTEIARGAGLKAQAQSLNQNSTHKIPINIDGVIYGIPVVAFA